MCPRTNHVILSLCDIIYTPPSPPVHSPASGVCDGDRHVKCPILLLQQMYIRNSGHRLYLHPHLGRGFSLLVVSEMFLASPSTATSIQIILALAFPTFLILQLDIKYSSYECPCSINCVTLFMSHRLSNHYNHSSIL